MVDFAKLLRSTRSLTRRRRQPPRPQGPAVLVPRPMGTRTYVAKRRALGSKTATKLLRYRKRKNPMAKKVVRGAIGGQATFSRWGATNPPNAQLKALKRVGAPNFYVTNDSIQATCAEGFQDYGLSSIMNTNDLKQIASYVTPSGVSALPKRFVLESATSEFMITNSTLATLYVDIYDIVRKRDAEAGLGQTYNPGNAWNQGVTDEVGGPNYYRTLNSLPTDSMLFKEYFKVVQRSHIGLAQGATHKHHVMLKPNKLINTALLNTKSVDEDLAGYVVYTMFVVYGQPCSVPGTPPVVTTASGALDIVKCVRYKYTWISDSTTNWFSTDNLSSIPGEQIVSAGAGQIVANAQV